jgi:DNA-binding response OmpR family regulator
MESSMNPILLVAEGDAELRELYQRLLAVCGYDVETAAHGLECLEKLRRLRPAVLILDRELRWGGSDGVLAWLREQSVMAGVLVVLTTTADCSAEVLGDVRPPVVKLLPKPFALTALLESVRTADSHRDERFNPNLAAACPELLIG